MESDLKNSLAVICGLLMKFKVQYLMIGGAAVALNGYFRYSINSVGMLANKPDIDIWYNPTYENYFNILNVIEALGQDVTEFRKEKTPNPHKSFFKLNFNDFTLDLLPTIKATIKFADANERKETLRIDGIDIYFINYVDLIKDKEATAREKDLEDIDQLKKLRGKD